MKITDTRGEYRAAYERFLVAQGECPHWDYTDPDSTGHACCEEMFAAKEACKRIAKKLTVA